MVATHDGLWDAPAPVPHLVLLDLRETPDAPPRNVGHDEVHAWDGARRARVRAASDWRIHGFHYVDAPAPRIFHPPRLRALPRRLSRPPRRPFTAPHFM